MVGASLDFRCTRSLVWCRTRRTKLSGLRHTRLLILDSDPAEVFGALLPPTKLLFLPVSVISILISVLFPAIHPAKCCYFIGKLQVKLNGIQYGRRPV